MKVNFRIILLLFFSYISIPWIISVIARNIFNKTYVIIIFHISNWNFISITFYITMVAHLELLEKENEYFYKFLVHRIARFTFSYGFSTFFIFWLLCIIEDFYLTSEIAHNNKFYVVTSYYNYIFLTLALIYENLTNTSRILVFDYYYKDLFISLIIIYSLWGIDILLSNLYDEKKITWLFFYFFIKKDAYESIGYLILIFFIVFNSYLVYFALIKRVCKIEKTYNILIDDTYKLVEAMEKDNFMNDKIIEKFKQSLNDSQII